MDGCELPVDPGPQPPVALKLVIPVCGPMPCMTDGGPKVPDDCDGGSDSDAHPASIITRAALPHVIRKKFIRKTFIARSCRSNAPLDPKNIKMR